MNKYLEYIEEQIKFHGSELEKYLNAREVVLKVEAISMPAKGTRRLSSPATATFDAAVRKTTRRQLGESFRGRVLHYMQANPDVKVTAASLTAVLFPAGNASKKDRHNVYNALSALAKKDLLAKEGQAYLALKPKKDEAA